MGLIPQREVYSIRHRFKAGYFMRPVFLAAEVCVVGAFAAGAASTPETIGNTGFSMPVLRILTKF
jgi:hypothetical protein